MTVKDPSKERVFQAGCFLTDHLRIHRVTLFPKDAAPNADKVGVDDIVWPVICALTVLHF